MDRVLQDLGQCGRFQICHVTLAQLCRFVTAWAFSLMIFGLYNPGWRCVQEHSNSTKTDEINTSVPFTMVDNQHAFSFHPTTATFSSRRSNEKLGQNSSSWLGYRRDTPEMSERPNASEPKVFNGTCDIVSSCTSIEISSSSSTIITEFGLICDRVWIGYLIVSVLNGGMFAGSFAWGQIGEMFGRKASLYGSTLLMSISCGLAIFSPVWEVYAAFTFFIGFGAVGVVPAVTVLCMEFLNSLWRARITSIPVWNMGIVCFALVTFLLKDWKFIHLTCSITGIIISLGMFWTPESLRWLMIHGKTGRAEKVVNNVCKVNSIPVPRESLKVLIDDVHADAELKQRNYSYLDLFRTRGMCILIIKLGLMRVVSMLTYDIIGFGIQSLPGDFYINIIVASIIEAPLCLCGGFLASKIGRRPTAIIFICTGAFCCTTIVVSLLFMNDGDIRGYLVTTMALINRSAIQAFVILSFVYTTELVPTVVRNLSLGYCEILGRIAGMLGPYLIPRNYTSMVACFGVLMVAQLMAAVIVFTLAETKDKPLGDTLEEINSPDKEENC